WRRRGGFRRKAASCPCGAGGRIRGILAAGTHRMRHPWKQAFAATLLALAIAGCSTVQVTRPTEVPDRAPEPVATGHWQFDAGDRPPAERDGYRPPRKLAVLLPLTGSLATAAGPVRDGLLAGYYGEQRRRPDLEFY